MFGFDKMFDFNRDGKLDSWERAAQFQFMDEMMKDDEKSIFDALEGKYPEDYSEEEQKELLVPLKKLIKESKGETPEDMIEFEVIPSLRKRIRDEKRTLYLNPYNLSDWIYNAFLEYNGKVNE